MSKRSDIDLLKDMAEATRRIMEYSNNLSYKQFIEDIKTQDAVVRNIEIIGEAAKGLSNVLRDRYPSIPWKEISGMRDKLIHSYFGVNWDIVWDVVTHDLPILYEEILRII